MIRNSADETRRAVTDDTRIGAPMEAVTVAGRDLVHVLATAGVSTDFDIAVYDRRGGWIAEIEAYSFRRRIVVEGPSAFYGGVYRPNPWTVEGGLCSIGAASYSHSPVPEGMVIGRYCSIAKGLKFLDFAHPVDWVSSSVAFFSPIGVEMTSCLSGLIDREAVQTNPDFVRRSFDPRHGLPYPTIGHDVWIGENVSLALGITIGTGSVVASGSVVTRDVPPYSVVAGVPAQVRRLRFSPEVVERMTAAAWWQWSFADLQSLDVSRPEAFLDALEARVAAGEIAPWHPRTLVLPDDVVAGSVNSDTANGSRV